MIEWLGEWFNGVRSGKRRGNVNVGESSLIAHRTETISPAYLVIEIEQTTGAHGPQRGRWLLAAGCCCWLLAECWWGESFHPSGFFGFPLWMFTRLPLLVCWHFFGGRRAEPATQVASAVDHHAHRRK